MNSDRRISAQVCFSIYSTMLGVNRVYRDLLAGFGLTYPQYLAMLVLWEEDGLSVSDICGRLFLETTTITPLLKRLEAQGLIVRRRSADDERKVIISLTRTGKNLELKTAHLPACVTEAMGESDEVLRQMSIQLNGIRQRLSEYRG